MRSAFLICLCFCVSWGKATPALGRVVVSTGPEVINAVALQMGSDFQQLRQIDRLAISSVRVSENLPQSWADYLEALVLEQLKMHTRIQVLSCTPCRARVTREREGRLEVLPGAASQKLLDETAETQNIDNYLSLSIMGNIGQWRVTLALQSARTKELLWIRSYDQLSLEEHSVGRQQEAAVIALARRGNSYQSLFDYHSALGLAKVPNTTTAAADTSALALSVIAQERIKEQQVGIRSTIYAVFSGLAASRNNEVEGDATSTSTKPFKAALSIAPTYSRSLLSPLTETNKVRMSANLSLGILLTTYYAAPLARLGSDFYFGRRTILAVGLVLTGSTSSKLTSGTTTTIASGTGAEVLWGIAL